MSPSLRENWRIVLLVVFVVASSVALFAPTGSAGDDGNATATSGGPTNLKYGLELSGGTRVRAPLVGMTAEDAGVTPENEQEVVDTVSAETGVSPADIEVRLRTRNRSTVEVFSENVTRSEFAAALQAAGLDATEGDIRRGVTAETRQTAVDVLNRKINLGGLQGGQAQTVTTATGEHFILVEVPNENRSAVLDLIGERGQVTLDASYPVETDNGTEYRQEVVIEREDFTSIQPAQEAQRGRPPRVPVTLTESDASRFSEKMQETGFTSPEGTGNCRYPDDPEADPEDTGYCLLTVVDDEVVYSASMGEELARGIENGDFEKDRSFVITATNFSEAQELQLNLRAGALPTELDIDDRGTTFFLAPTLASEFKFLSLLTGFVAVVAVSLTVFARYGSIGVSAPMLVTAMSEVYLLLGFAVAVGLALDLSHIAGFIAVIGTGVDDLIIIADEILQSGEVKTSRVFESRFRKAFWVIGAAAATTIIAMSPLAVLSLGDLQGFAIVTIVGVLLGVLVTRPAYGDILRNVVLGEDMD